MRNICLAISYDGTSYSGFQKQPKGSTIQETLEQAIERVTGETVKLIASGRTDAGVHARMQVANFVTDSDIQIERWCLALNNYLPNDILVWHASEVPLAFHARKMAKQKTYIYTIRSHSYPDVFQSKTQYHINRPLDAAAMQDAVTYFVGEHDFTSFCSAKTQKSSHVRIITDATVEAMPLGTTQNNPFGNFSRDHKPQQLITITMTGNGFLHSMVRIIAGTLIQVGEGRRHSSDIPSILSAKDRSLAGPTAPAQGLMLWNVHYDGLIIN